jgi:hypothetical protein
VTVEGWQPVEDIVRWGFAHAPMVMANEAHSDRGPVNEDPVTEDPVNEDGA